MMFKTTIKQKRGKEKGNGRGGEDLNNSTGSPQADAAKRRKCVKREKKRIYFVFDDVFVIIIRVTFSFLFSK